MVIRILFVRIFLIIRFMKQFNRLLLRSLSGDS
jgi:hypothetical protein